MQSKTSAIRQMLKEGKHTTQQLASLFNVSWQYVNQVSKKMNQPTRAQMREALRVRDVLLTPHRKEEARWIVI